MVSSSSISTASNHGYSCDCPIHAYIHVHVHICTHQSITCFHLHNQSDIFLSQWLEICCISCNGYIDSPIFIWSPIMVIKIDSNDALCKQCCTEQLVRYKIAQLFLGGEFILISITSSSDFLSLLSVYILYILSPDFPTTQSFTVERFGFWN